MNVLYTTQALLDGQVGISTATHALWSTDTTTAWYEQLATLTITVWVKPVIAKETIKTYDLVISLDLDTVFTYLIQTSTVTMTREAALSSTLDLSFLKLVDAPKIYTRDGKIAFEAFPVASTGT
ncbi:hypothetical protein FSPOR_4982 [Fusarium sporotrichioides]|uniref:Uncharacterized protein n=1 Tax=Fusarium sporotrichioides TaxID=5514 RepID=A0A395S9W4_FUSSP|nr:hypothetical protein FSPOR_4982 [Fusarium sporotrichioides]